MTLESGDRIFVSIEPTRMTLQIIEGCYAEASDDDERGDCDFYALDRRQTSRFMWLLRQAGNGAILSKGDNVILKDSYGKELLSVGSAVGRFFIYGRDNTCGLEMHEAYALLCTISTRIWRMFE